MNEKWIDLIVAVLYCAAVVIPLVYELVKYVKMAIKEKNWALVISKVMGLMATAEKMFNEGAERKEWVLAMLKESADTINYDIDYAVISDMIDQLCKMSKKVNVRIEKVDE